MKKSWRLALVFLLVCMDCNVVQATSPKLDDPPRNTGHLFDLPAGCSESAADGWAAAGLARRPSWVSVCVEHRLRLLSALPAIKASVDRDQMAYLGGNGPGLAVGLTLDDGLFYSEGFGFRDAGRSIPPDENTIFQAGSISKLMTGATLSVLIDDPARHISLQDTANQHLGLRKPWLESNSGPCRVLRRPPAPPPATPSGPPDCHGPYLPDSILLAHLVSHTSGLPGALGADSAYGNGFDWLAALQRAPPLFTPGAYSAYANAGADVVGAVIAHETGLSYQDAVRTFLFAPLRMSRSSMSPAAPGVNVARLWSFKTPAGRIVGPARFLLEDTPADVAFLDPAGGLSTTVSDLSRFMTMWLVGYAPSRQGRPILKDETIAAAAVTPFQWNPDTVLPFGCSSGVTTDPVTGFVYSPCDRNDKFGVFWRVTIDGIGRPIYIGHNGNYDNLSGGDLILNLNARYRIAAVALVSTQAFPGIAAPPGVYGRFIEHVTEVDVLNSALTEDQRVDWLNSPLAIGVARLLLLSGGDAALAAPRGLEASPIAHFSPAFIAKHQLTARRTIEGVPAAQYVTDTIFAQVQDCSTFRVRRVDGERSVTLRFSCVSRGRDVSKNLDLTLKVDEQGLIDDLSAISATYEDY